MSKLSKEDLNAVRIIREFMSRVDLKGVEVAAFIEVAKFLDRLENSPVAVGDSGEVNSK